MHNISKTKPRITKQDIALGKRLEEIRTSKGVSRKNLGSFLEITYQQIQKYEKGKNRISALTMHRIAEYLEVPIAFFFDATPYEGRDHKLAEKTLVRLGSAEFEHIEESFHKQFGRHKDWIHDAIEAGIKFSYGQSTANNHYDDIQMVSTKLVLAIGQKIIKNISEGLNDN